MLNKTEDALRALGLMTLGSRLKRLGERLQAEVQPILGELSPPVPAGQHPLLAALSRHGAVTVGELAALLGVAQPGVTRALGQLAALGLLTVATTVEDGRRRLVSLTPQGEAFVAAARAGVWRRVEEAVADLCVGFGEELLAHLASIEDGLAARPLATRAGENGRDDTT